MNIRSTILSAALFAGFVLPPAGICQSNELSILAGATTSAASVTAPGVSVSAGVTASVQVDYAHRLKETAGGKLYFELPAARVLKASVGINPNFVNVGQSQFFVTPGLRYVFAPEARVAPYVAGGFGFGWYNAANLTVIGGPVNVNVTEGFKPAAGIGAGAMLRITRGFAMRAEVRDYINCASNAPNRNHVAFNAGFGFRF
jgi:hypothetical protein